MRYHLDRRSDPADIGACTDARDSSLSVPLGLVTIPSGAPILITVEVLFMSFGVPKIMKAQIPISDQ